MGYYLRRSEPDDITLAKAMMTAAALKFVGPGGDDEIRLDFAVDLDARTVFVTDGRDSAEYTFDELA